MSPVQRKVSGDVLHFRLQDERAQLDDSELLERHGRNARTLVKHGAMRLTLITVAAGGKIGRHRAAGPISVQVLQGGIGFHAAGQEYQLDTGDLLVLAGGVEHEVDSSAGGTFLLTVLQPDAGSS